MTHDICKCFDKVYTYFYVYKKSLTFSTRLFFLETHSQIEPAKTSSTCVVQ